jgi:hypothetical protein
MSTDAKHFPSFVLISRSKTMSAFHDFTQQYVIPIYMQEKATPADGAAAGNANGMSQSQGPEPNAAIAAGPLSLDSGSASGPYDPAPENRIALLLEKKRLEDKLKQLRDYRGREEDEMRLEQIRDQLGEAPLFPPPPPVPKVDPDLAPPVKDKVDLNKQIADGKDKITHYVGNMTQAIDLYFSQLSDALNQFGDAIRDTKLEKKEEGDSLRSAIFKAFDIFITVAFPEEIIAEVVAKAGAKALAEITKAVVELGKEAKKAPSGKTTYHEYIFEIRDTSSKTHTDKVNAIRSNEETLKTQFENAAKEDFARIQAKPGAPRLAPLVLTAAKTSAERLKATLDAATFQSIEQYIATEFAGRPGSAHVKDKSDSPSKIDPRVATGTLYFRIDVSVAGTGLPNERIIRISKASSEWLLVMLGEDDEEAAGVAKALLESAPGGRPWNIHLPRKIRLSVTDKSSGTTREGSGWAVYNAGNARLGAPDTLEDPHGDTGLLNEALGFQNVIAAATGTAKLTGSVEMPTGEYY